MGEHLEVGQRLENLLLTRYLTLPLAAEALEIELEELNLIINGEKVICKNFLEKLLSRGFAPDHIAYIFSDNIDPVF